MNRNDTDATPLPEDPNRQPDELAYQESALMTYLDERYRMLAEILELYLLYAEPSNRSNPLVGSMADEFDDLAQMLNYEDFLAMTDRLNKQSEDLGDREAPTPEDDDAFIGTDEFFNSLFIDDDPDGRPLDH
ncbi:MAG: hypothetical protein ABI700_01320 [Chloroflexota bacterium]